MISTKDIGSNYLAEVVTLPAPRKHTNADRLQCVSLFGCNIITGLTAQEGDLYVYFPVESAINKDYLSWSNSFEEKSLNKDQSVKGYFNHRGRVRAMSLRGEKSQGYIIPISDLEEYLQTKGIKIKLADYVGQPFDTIGDILICEKYVPPFIKGTANAPRNPNKNVERRFNQLVENQFRFHIDTAHLGRNAHNIQPDDIITISAKLHGTSSISSYILCNRKLTWLEKFLTKPIWGKIKYAFNYFDLGFIFNPFKVKIQQQEYNYIYASRSVVKNKYINSNVGAGYYGVDIWQMANEQLKGALHKGMTFYYEISGYLPSGKMVQKGYDYGCKPGEFRIDIYRITLTNPDGHVTELDWEQVKAHCKQHGLNYVPEYYHGKAKDLFPELATDLHWNENFLQKLSEKYLEKDCDMCVNKVPGEGVCLRVKDNDIRVYKHKSFRFTQRESLELDKEEVDIETEESVKE